VHRRLTFRSPIRFFPDSTLLAFLFTSSGSSIWSFYFLFMRVGGHLIERVAMGRFILSFGIPLRLEARSIWIILRLASLEMLFMTLASRIFFLSCSLPLVFIILRTLCYANTRGCFGTPFLIDIDGTGITFNAQKGRKKVTKNFSHWRW